MKEVNISFGLSGWRNKMRINGANGGNNANLQIAPMLLKEALRTFECVNREQ